MVFHFRVPDFHSFPKAMKSESLIEAIIEQNFSFKMVVTDILIVPKGDGIFACFRGF